jgi:hypothetical protein
MAFMRYKNVSQKTLYLASELESNGFINIRLSVEYLIISDTFNIDEYISFI